jgi:hypothetical protein
MTRHLYRDRELYGYEGLACAMLKLAIEEARQKGSRGPAARQFLRSTGCRILVDNLLWALGLQNELAADELMEQLWRSE